MPRALRLQLAPLLVILLSLVACSLRNASDATSPSVVIATPRPSVFATSAEISPSATVLPSPIATPLPSAPTTMPSPALTGLPAAAPTAEPEATIPATVDLVALRLRLQPIQKNLDVPVALGHAGDGSNRLFVVEKSGHIMVWQDSALSQKPFLDITSRVGSANSEQGLLGLAFHPEYRTNGWLFVNYTNLDGDTVISRFTVSADPGQVDAGSELVVLTLDQPASNHNGGHLAFGPDGYLYIGTGDGGAAGDKFGNGQNGQTLLGAMLRLDVNQGQPYTVPGDNPFVGDPNVRDEIWAMGVRNPWRYSFDRANGDLYIADVGQNEYEEVNIQPAASSGGENYGWPIMEGLHCYPADRDCDSAGLTLPVVEYSHSQGCSITGGYVYRGREFPSLSGLYLFGDYCSGRIWGLAPKGSSDWQIIDLIQVDARISSFGEDEAGELYLLDMRDGILFKVVAE